MLYNFVNVNVSIVKMLKKRIDLKTDFLSAVSARLKIKSERNSKAKEQQSSMQLKSTQKCVTSEKNSPYQTMDILNPSTIVQYVKQI